MNELESDQVVSQKEQSDQQENASQLISALTERVNSVLIGQPEVVEQVIIALLANGHVLLEGVPGLGKTLLVRALASCFEGSFKRIQFTPDLMPSDITGHALYDMKEACFRIRKGPVFTHLLLADEINRAPAKTQAALLEVMQEKQVTIEGSSMPLPQPFMVLATQNPIEQEGTYPLPEAELDRFLIKVFIDYPSCEDEVELATKVTRGVNDDTLLEGGIERLLTADDILSLQKLAATVMIDEQVVDYAVRLVRATRNNAGIAHGAGPRASIALVRCARIKALMRGSNFVLPDDIKSMVLPILRHRVILAADREIDGFSTDSILLSLLDTVDAPRK